MGCINSKKDINEIHPNIFQVTNVDDGGRAISPGQLEVTETELVFYQRGKGPTRWPLRCLRKYGFDIEIFSFECGRRCPTGHGIYAFHCLKAELLFNLVQQSIQLRNLTDDNLQISDFPVPFASTGPPVHRRTSSQADSYLNPSNNQIVRTHPTLSRPGSITSNGPMSPPAMSPSSLSESNFEQNNNKRDSLILDRSYTNTYTNTFEENINSPSYINVTMSNNIPNENYINLQETNNHLYMNVDCNGVTADSPKEMNQDLEYVGHCYANIDTNELSLKPNLRNIDLDSAPHTPTSLCIPMKEVNYAELDLPNKSEVEEVPESPVKGKKSYVTIDFNKTNALSHSINPRIEIEEGSRKTRHNSTISDVPPRHSSISD